MNDEMSIADLCSRLPVNPDSQGNFDEKEDDFENDEIVSPPIQSTSTNSLFSSAPPPAFDADNADYDRPEQHAPQRPLVDMAGRATPLPASSMSTLNLQYHQASAPSPLTTSQSSKLSDTHSTGAKDGSQNTSSTTRSPASFEEQEIVAGGTEHYSKYVRENTREQISFEILCRYLGPAAVAQLAKLRSEEVACVSYLLKQHLVDYTKSSSQLKKRVTGGTFSTTNKNASIHDYKERVEFDNAHQEVPLFAARPDHDDIPTGKLLGVQFIDTNETLPYAVRIQNDGYSSDYSSAQIVEYTIALFHGISSHLGVANSDSRATLVSTVKGIVRQVVSYPYVDGDVYKDYATKLLKGYSNAYVGAFSLPHVRPLKVLDERTIGASKTNVERVARFINKHTQLQVGNVLDIKLSAKNLWSAKVFEESQAVFDRTPLARAGKALFSLAHLNTVGVSHFQRWGRQTKLGAYYTVSVHGYYDEFLGSSGTLVFNGAYREFVKTVSTSAEPIAVALDSLYVMNTTGDELTDLTVRRGAKSQERSQVNMYQVPSRISALLQTRKVASLSVKCRVLPGNFSPHQLVLLSIVGQKWYPECRVTSRAVHGEFVITFVPSDNDYTADMATKHDVALRNLAMFYSGMRVAMWSFGVFTLGLTPQYTIPKGLRVSTPVVQEELVGNFVDALSLVIKNVRDKQDKLVENAGKLRTGAPVIKNLDNSRAQSISRTTGSLATRLDTASSS